MLTIVYNLYIIDLLKCLCKYGLPTDNVFEFAALTVLKFEKKWKIKKRKELQERIKEREAEQKKKKEEEKAKKEEELARKKAEEEAAMKKFLVNCQYQIIEKSRNA